jgi:spore germination protein
MVDWLRSLMTWTALALLGMLVAGWAATDLGSRPAAAFSGVDHLLIAQAAALTTHPVSTSGHVNRSGLPAGLVLGYFYDSPSDPNAVSFLKPYLPVLTGIIPFWYTIEKTGRIEGQTNPAVIGLAVTHHLYTFALVTNMAGAPVFSPLLASPAAENRAIQNMLTLVEVNGFDGVNLDWEGLAPQDRYRFTAFVQALAEVFHAHGYYVTLSVPAETADEPQNGWTGAYDYRALGRYADLLMIMAYDQHNQSSGPGPVASTAWVTAVLKYAVRAIPPAKVVLGVPGYGYDWSPSGNQALSWYQAAALARQYDKSGQTGHFVYMQGGQVHDVYFENAATFLQKMRLVTGFGIRGLALWRLGIEDPKIWGYLQ